MTQPSGKVFKSKDHLSRDELADLLTALAERIRTGSVTLGSAGAQQQVDMGLPASVSVEMEVTDSTKRTGVQREFELEMQWRVDTDGAPIDEQRADRGFSIS